MTKHKYPCKNLKCLECAAKAVDIGTDRLKEQMRYKPPLSLNPFMTLEEMEATRRINRFAGYY